MDSARNTQETLSDALSAALDAMVPESISEEDPQKAYTLAKSTREFVDIDGRRRFYQLREKWSKWIICWITGLIVFNCLLAILVGLSWLDFTKYQWFITAITVETFLQIVGMGLVAVNFLFKDSK